jgi:hypothetical protein
MPDGGVAVKPSKWGAEFSALPYDEVLGAGSAGPGKTYQLILEPLAQVITEHERMTNPDHPYPIAAGESTGWCLHLRRTLPMIEQTVVRALRVYRQLDPGGVWEASKMTFRFSSGYRVQFGHCSEIGDWDRYMSSEYSLILWDELVQFHEEQYDQIITRLRSSDPVLCNMLKVRAMSNPLMKRGANENFSLGDPQWVKRRFVDPAPTGKVVIEKELELQSGEKVVRTRMYYPATLYDNPDPIFIRNYDIQLANAPMHIQQALRYGSWEVTEGSFFGGDWRQKLHVCEPFEIPPHWPIFRSMDWGFKQPGNIHWYAMDDEDNLFVIRELRFEGQIDIAVAKAAREVEKSMDLWKDHRSTISGWADTQLWEMRGATLKSMAQVFQEMGVPWKQADKRSRQRNAQLVLKRLRDHSEGTTTPGLVFFSTCRHAIRTIPAIQTSQTNTEEPAKGGDDHAYDSISYGCAGASHGRAGVGDRRTEDDDYEEMLEEQVNRGKYGYGSEVC